MKLGSPYLSYIPQIKYTNKYTYTTNKFTNFKQSKAPQIPIIVDNQEKFNNKNSFFDIKDLNIDSDDFLILGLLLFLYIEDIDDQILYIILLMLLIN